MRTGKEAYPKDRMAELRNGGLGRGGEALTRSRRAGRMEVRWATNEPVRQNNFTLKYEHSKFISYMTRAFTVF